MESARGGTAGVSGAQQHSDIIDVSSGAPVTGAALDFPRPQGAVPLAPFLDAESQARGHLLQLVIDAASVKPPARPAGLEEHIGRLWHAVQQLVWSDSPSNHRRLVPDLAAANRQRTVERFLKSVDRAIPAPRTVPVDELREVIAIVDQFLNPRHRLAGDALRGFELVRAALVAMVAP